MHAIYIILLHCALLVHSIILNIYFELVFVADCFVVFQNLFFRFKKNHSEKREDRQREILSRRVGEPHIIFELSLTSLLDFWWQ